MPFFKERAGLAGGGGSAHAKTIPKAIWKHQLADRHGQLLVPVTVGPRNPPGLARSPEARLPDSSRVAAGPGAHWRKWTSRFTISSFKLDGTWSGGPGEAVVGEESPGTDGLRRLATAWAIV